ncbi:MAG TPA: hypothetical protein VMF13_14830 [Luteitalea sp.]|nr:hypothetical protein [Luteitalea sp.]
MPILHLQCSLDRLGPAYELARPYFLLSVSVAFATAPADADEVRARLRPWSWSRLKTLSVFSRGPGGAWAPVTYRALDPEPLAHEATLRAALEHELDLQLADFQADDFVWTPEAPATTTPSTLSSGRKGRDWRAWLAHVGTYPGGIATTINLARVFVPDVAPADDAVLLAVPHLEIDGLTFEPLDPATDAAALEELAAGGGVYRWRYAGGTAQAYVNQPLRPATNPGTFINIETLWRNPVASTVATDWTARFDDRIASLFDGVERLLEWLRAQDAAAPTPARMSDHFFAAMFEVVRGAVDSSQRPSAGATLSGVPQMVEPSLGPLPARPPAPVEWAGLVRSTLDRVVGDGPRLEWPEESAVTIGAFREAWTSIQSTFRTDAALTAVVLETWRQMLQVAPATWETVRERLREGLQASAEPTRLHHLLLLHRAGDTWRALLPANTAPGRELDVAGASVESQLLAFGRNLWDGGPESWTMLLRDAARRQKEGARSEPFDVTSDGLTIQVDRIQSVAMSADDDRQDYLRQITGVGVLMRRPGGPWRTLNVATLEVLRPGPDGTLSYAPVDDEPFVVPVRTSYGRDLRQGFISYVNQPLVARSPWAGLTPSRVMQPGAPADTTLGFVRYESAYGPPPAWQLERLVYGEAYDVAVFYVGNGGALPVELARDDGNGGKLPWAFALPAASATLPGTTRLTYLRRCPIGAVRIEPDAVRGYGPLPPPLPDRVHPIAAVLEDDPERPAPVLVLLPSNTSGWNTSVARNTFGFTLRPPALDVKVWDRWVLNTPNDADAERRSRDRRRTVLGEVHTLRFELDTGRVSGADASVDDPAVVGFEIAMEQVWPGHATGPSVRVTFAAATGEGLRGEQRPGVPIVVSSAGIGTPEIGGDASGCRIRVPDGEVWRVHLAPIVDPSSGARFDPAVRAKLAPTTFVVEVASRLLEGTTERDAAALLRSALHLASSDDQATLSVDGSTLGALGARVHRAEVLVQQWRWDGRPVYELPAADPPRSGVPFTVLGDLHGFDGDGLLFQSRENSDVQIAGTQVELVHEPLVRARLHELRWGSKPGLLYFRLGARLYGRYEGLEQTPAVVDSTMPTAGGKSLEWLRHATRCRWAERVPTPAVKLVVPLTEGFDSSDPADRGPGWLVVLDEPWYLDSFGGLGEVLCSELCETRLPDGDERRPQAGPDGVIDMRPDPYNGWTFDLPRPLGAIGSTFDTDTQAPLFGKSSFFQRPPMLRPPEGAPAEAPDLSFHFFKLRFRRAIAGLDATAPRERCVYSDWTEGYWVQSLPPSNWWRVRDAGGTRDERVRIDDLAYAPQSSRIVWNGQAASILPTGPVPQPAESRSRFEIYALVTRRVQDGFGRRDQETFVALTHIDALATATFERSTAQVRLVEVQFRALPGEPLPVAEGPRSLETLVEALFPREDAMGSPIDAAARIVRMSPRLRRV